MQTKILSTEQTHNSRPIFVLRLRPEKGINPIHGLRHALKELLRRHGLRCVSVCKLPPDRSEQ
jgi:hypothetical protein